MACSHLQSDHLPGSIVMTKLDVLQILEALDYMHTRCQIIHTDLKPENVMLTEAIRPQRAALVAAARAGELTEACLPPASAPGKICLWPIQCS